MTTQTPRWDVGPDETVIEDSARSADEPTPKERSALKHVDWRLVAAIVGGVVVILGILYVVGYFVAGDKLPKKAQISGVAVGGLHPSEAIDKLTTELGPTAAEPLNLTVRDEQSQLKPADAGLAVDYPKSVEAAGGGKSLNPLRIVKVLTGGSAVDAVVVVDEPKLQAAVGGLTKTFNHAPVDAAVAYKGVKIKQQKAREGTTLQQDAATAVLRSSFLTGSGPVELPADVAQPAVTDEEADQVVADFAKPAIAAPVKVKVANAGSFEVSPRMLASSIEFLPQNGTLVPALDAKKLRHSARPAIKKVELVEPRDATVRLVKGKPKVIPAVNGTTVAADDLKRAVEPVLIKPAAERRVSAQLTGAKATFSTADAKKLRHQAGDGKVHYLLSLPPVSQHQHRQGGGLDQRHVAQARGRLLAQQDRRGANRSQRFHQGFHHQGRQVQEGTWWWGLAECHNHVQRHVLCRTQGHLPQAARLVYRPLPGRSRGNSGMAWCRPQVPKRHQVRRIGAGLHRERDTHQEGIHHGEDVVHQDVRQGRRDCSDQVQLQERAGGHRRFDEMRAE